jgi:hypothetical protein
MITTILIILPLVAAILVYFAGQRLASTIAITSMHISILTRGRVGILYS